MAKGNQAETEDPIVEASDAKTTTTDADVVQEKDEADLETLLAEYGNESDSKTNRTDDDSSDEDEVKLSEEDIRFLRAEKIRKANERVESDMKHAIKLARGDTDLPEEADVVIEGLLHQSVASDPKMRAAWEGRAQDPQKWDKILTKQSEKFAALIDKIVESRSGSTSALEAAVHSAKTSSPLSKEAPSLGSMTRMSDAEFSQYTRG